MREEILSVSELGAEDIEYITNYWLLADAAHLTGMGVDISKIPPREEWIQMLSGQIGQHYTDKQSYCIIWRINDKPIGHSNVNKIVFGEAAYMHLHIWDKPSRKKGYGEAFIKKTIPYFFKNLQLKRLYCEPYALNPAPNKTLEKVGFMFLRSYITTPAWLNFEQQVNLWGLDAKHYNNTSLQQEF